MHKLFSFALALLAALLLAACGTAPQAAQPTSAPQASQPSAAPTAAMAHGDMGRSAQDSNAPYDARFIDSMIAHHQGAIEMANQALTEASRPELKALAENIISAQQTEITQMQQWRQAWYPGLALTGGMGMSMGAMSISADAGKPFDQRFIEAMIPHHEGAIEMAKDAQQKAERSEIKTLAGAIIQAQEAEIAQMQQWQKAWFGQ